MENQKTLMNQQQYTNLTSKVKKYIGKTTDIERRMNQHFYGNGAKVTQRV